MKKTLILFFVGSLIAIIIALFTLTSSISRWAVAYLFEEQKLSLSESTRVDYDPFINELTLSDFQVLHDNNKVLAKFDHLLVNLEILPLFDKKLIVNNMLFSGLDLAVSLNGDKTYLNGWDLNNITAQNTKGKPQSNINDTAAAVISDQQIENTDVTESQVKESSLNSITINNIAFKDIRIAANIVDENNVQAHEIVISELNIKPLQLDLTAASKPLVINASINTLLKYQLVDEAKGMKLATGLKFSAHPVINFSESEPQHLNLTSDSIVVSLSDLTFSDKNQDVDITLATLNNILKNVSLTKSESITGSMMLNTKLIQLVTNSIKTENSLLKLGELSTSENNINFSYSPDNLVKNTALTYNVDMPLLELTDLISMQDKTDVQPTLLNLSTLAVHKAALKNTGISIDRILIGETNANLVLGKNKQLENLYMPQSIQVNETGTSEAIATNATVNEAVVNEAVVNKEAVDVASVNSDSSIPKESNKAANLRKTTERQAAKDAIKAENKSRLQIAKKLPASLPVVSQSEDDKIAMTIKLNELVNIGPVTVNTLDKSVEPNYQSTLLFNKLRVADIDNTNPMLVAMFELDATNNTYAKIQFKDQSQLFIDKPQHDITVTLDEIDLSSVSPYLSSALGYHINSGQLDSKIKAKIDGNKLDGKANLLMRSVDLTAISNQGEESSFSGGAISFNYALSMLKDGDGNVDLTVPFDGDLNNPSVGFSGFLSLIVQRATMSAAKDYLINTFVPYANVVSFAMAAGKHVLKMRFTDLIFETNQEELGELQAQRLSELALVLNKHNTVSIKICPVSSVAELKLDPENISKLTAKNISEQQVSKLLKIAQNKAELVKNQLVNNGKVASKRLLACSATIDYSDSGKSRVGFSQL